MVLTHWTRAALRRALSLILALSCSAGSVFAQSPTFARTDYPFLGNDHTIGDFNGDGKIDLAGLGLQTAKVMLGNGDGTFQGSVESPASSVSQVQALAAGDFNRDGLLDLMVTINDLNVGLSFLAGRGNGTFDAPVTFPNSWGRSSGTIAAVDLNNDLNLDVVIGHEVTCWTAPCIVARTITVMLGNGNGTFQAPQFIQEPGLLVPQYQAVADYNGDGRLDLALTLANGNEGLMEIRNGNGDGTFGPRVMYLVPPPQSSIGGLKIHATDFNNDGKPDLSLTWGVQARVWPRCATRPASRRRRLPRRRRSCHPPTARPSRSQ